MASTLGWLRCCNRNDGFPCTRTNLSGRYNATAFWGSQQAGTHNTDSLPLNRAGDACKPNPAIMPPTFLSLKFLWTDYICYLIPYYCTSRRSWGLGEREGGYSVLLASRPDLHWLGKPYQCKEPFGRTCYLILCYCLPLPFLALGPLNPKPRPSLNKPTLSNHK